VEQVAASLRPLVQQHQHTLTLSLTKRPIIVDGDPGRLNQVVTNLLENAVKYTEPGGQITLTLEQQDTEAVLSVRDNGIGIAPEKLGGIFETFAQADTARARSSGGLGLGLSVVQRVVQLHGGRVKARSAGNGAGSELVVWLPTVSADPAWQPRLLAKTPFAGAVSATRKVLVVDDREEVTRSLARLLRAWGHEVAVAGDAATALTLATAFQPDSAIVDLGLPVVTGYELAPRLREALPNRRLFMIAFTGDGDARARDNCRAAGFDACVVKPGDPVILAQLLRDSQNGSG
jgi:CheY-like chemotaxis protein